MKDYEALAKCMREYRLAKIALDADGNVRSMIALPPEQEAPKFEELTQSQLEKQAEQILFAAVEGTPIFNGKS